MRFSETLRYNANPDWWTHYIAYDELKHHVAVLKQLKSRLFFACTEEPDSSDDDAEHAGDDIVGAQDSIAISVRRSASKTVLAGMDSRISATAARKAAHESAARNTLAAGYLGALGGSQPTDFPPPVVPMLSKKHLTGPELRARMAEEEGAFFEKLDLQAEVIDGFYVRLCKELDRIEGEIEQDANALMDKLRAAPSVSADLVEHTPLLSARGGVQEVGAPHHFNKFEMQRLRRRFIEHYREVAETINFATLNRNGFDKILKKHDKCSGFKTRAEYMDRLRRTVKFWDSSPLEDLRMRTEATYAELYTGGDLGAACDELSEGLRDMVVWDRNTIWRDMLRTERRVSALQTRKGGAGVDLGAPSATKFVPKLPNLLLAFVVFCVIMLCPNLVRALPVPGGTKYSDETLDASHRCLALLMAVIILWAGEGLPLYVTSLFLIPASVVLRVFLNDDGSPHKPTAAAHVVFQSMGSATIMLIICVYSLGAALSKFGLDKIAATAVLSRVRRAERLLFVVMCLSVFVSMFVSNVAAPVLLNSILMPVLQDMPQSAKPFVRCVLFGVMIGSNIGGFASPISSPQSAVALGLLLGRYRVSFMQWLVAALPQCALMILASFSVLLLWFKPHRYNLPAVPRHKEKLEWPHYAIIVTLVFTVALWALHRLSSMFGSSGMVAALPLVVFFGSGILNKEDFNNLPWDVVYLVAGGVVLGSAVESSQLLSLITGRLNKAIGSSSLWMAYIIFCTFMAVIANAVSHTVSAIIVLPLISEIGLSLGHPRLLVLGGTFAASVAMALPISSFPNISAAQVTDEVGNPYLNATDILRVGVAMTFICTLVILTFGFALMFWLWPNG